MHIRSFQSGDEFEQLKIYNSVAAALPKFKPATILDIQRRTTASDFDAGSRLYAVENGAVVGYCTFQRNGRVGFPWCLPGAEAAAEPLFEYAIRSMKERGIGKAFTAYRKDWPTITEFFLSHQFSFAREMVNFVMAFENMPTPSARLSSTVTPATPADAPGILSLDPSVFRVNTAEALREALWNNPYLKPESIFVMRNKADGAPLAAGIFVNNALYASPRAVDADMPCFRLGAFGTEGMTTKRINGLFSFVTAPRRSIFSIGMDMLSYAINLIGDDDEITCYGAQVASDAPALLAFYQQTFERQGSFPVYERDLSKA